jgi:hypothetical protein
MTATISASNPTWPCLKPVRPSEVFKLRHRLGVAPSGRSHAPQTKFDLIPPSSLYDHDLKRIVDLSDGAEYLFSTGSSSILSCFLWGKTIEPPSVRA